MKFKTPKHSRTIVQVFFFALAYLSVGTEANAQPGGVYGTVMDCRGGSEIPLSAARVVIKDMDSGEYPPGPIRYTKEDGTYSFTNIPALPGGKPYAITVRLKPFRNVPPQEVIIEPGLDKEKERICLIERDSVERILPDSVAFSRNSAVITEDMKNREGLAFLNQRATDLLNAPPGAYILLSGHRSSDETDNTALARVSAVREYLTKKEVPETRIQVRSFSDSCPLTTGDPARNRRVTYKLIAEGQSVFEVDLDMRCGPGSIPRVYKPKDTPDGPRSPKYRSATDYAGFWQNVNGDLGYIQFLEIAAGAPDRLQIQAWLRCNPTPAQGGTIKDCVHWGKDEVYINSDNVLWAHDERQKRGKPPGPVTWMTVTFKHALTLRGDRLNVHVDKFGDGYNSFKRRKRP